MLMFAARIAIWDRNKIVVMVAMGIWLTNLSFLIYSKSLHLGIGSYNVPCLLLHQVSCRSVLNLIDYLSIFGLSNCSSGLPGHLRKAPVHRSKQTAADIISSPRSPLT